MGAYVVEFNPQTRVVTHVLKNACPGPPSRIGRTPGEREVCGKRGRFEAGGVWYCTGHHGAFERAVRDYAEDAAAEEQEHLMPAGRCVFPTRRDGKRPSPLCGEAASEAIGTAWACPRHFREAMEWMRDREKADKYALDAEIEARREAEMATWAARGSQVVYYLRRESDGIIKIGTSTELWRRRRNLARQHGPLQLLLSHCGTHAREHEMHRKFDHLALGGEWFRPGADLLLWIFNVRQRRANAETVTDDTVPLGVIRKLLREAKAAEAARVDTAVA
jgi:hypothetical protein